MSHALPPVGHPAREMFDISDLVEIGTGKRPIAQIPTIASARGQARRLFDACPAAKRVCFIVLRAENDQIDLISFGRRGGWRREWRFGPLMLGRAAA